MININAPLMDQNISSVSGKRLKSKKVFSTEKIVSSKSPEEHLPEAIAAQLNTYCAMFEYFGWHGPLALVSAARDELLKLSCQQMKNNASNAP